MRSIAGTLFLTDFRSRCQLLIPRPIGEARAAANATGFTSSGGLISFSLRRLAKMETATPIRDLLFTLLLKVGVASSIAALLARWNTFRRVLFTEDLDPDQKVKLMLFMTPALFDFLVRIAVLGEKHAPKRVPPRQQRRNGRRHAHLEQQGEQQVPNGGSGIHFWLRVSVSQANANQSVARCKACDSACFSRLGSLAWVASWLGRNFRFRWCRFLRPFAERNGAAPIDFFYGE